MMDIDILFFLNSNGNLFLDEFVKTISFGPTWTILYITLCILIIRNNKTMSQILLIFCCGLLGLAMAGGFSDLVIKPMTERLRPCNDPMIRYSLHLVEGVFVSGYSFYSCHSANTFSLAMFFSLLTRSGLLSGTLFLWALLNAWSRLYLGVHFPSDVFVGITWGLIVGCIVYVIYLKLFCRIYHHGSYVSTKYTRTGYSYIDIDVCVSVVILTILYAIIKSLIIF